MLDQSDKESQIAGLTPVHQFKRNVGTNLLQKKNERDPKAALAIVWGAARLECKHTGKRAYRLTHP